MRNPNTPAWQQFEDLVRRILEANGFDIKIFSPRGDREFDFLGSKDGKTWAIEVKHYRTANAQPRLIQSAAIRVVNNGLISNVHRGMLVVSCVLPPDLRHFLKTRYRITFFDRNDLKSLASAHPALGEELSAITEDSSTPQGVAPEMVDGSAISATPLEVTAALPEDNKGTELCQKLHQLDPGKAEWKAYEELCTEILRYLFENDLSGWEEQRETSDGVNRYDLVCRIRPTREFWRFLIDHLNSRYVLFEFKNYGKPIRQGQVLTTEKYLLEKGLRRVAIILTRLGGDKGAVLSTQGAMREHGKLLLLLEDSDVCEMLHRKQRGEDPTDYLFDIADRFLLSLPR